MSFLLRKTAFLVDGVGVTWGDVVLDAALRGAWGPLEQHVREAMACEAEAARAGTPPPEGELERSAERFRYDRDLVTARQMESWLERWELSAGDWTGYLRREMWRTVLAGTIARLAAELAPSQEEWSRLCFIDAACSGRLTEFAVELAGRVAAARAVGAVGLEAPAPTSDRRDPLAALNCRALPGELEHAWERAAAIRGLGAELDRFRTAVVTDRAVRDMIASRRLDWILVHYGAAIFSDAGAANEAVMCVRDDGRDLAEVAAAARAPYQEEQLYLDEFAEPARDRLLGARSGELVGPVAVGERWALYDVREKSLPAESDGRIRQRAEAAVLDAAIEREAQQRVRWVA